MKEETKLYTLLIISLLSFIIIVSPFVLGYQQEYGVPDIWVKTNNTITVNVTFWGSEDINGILWYNIYDQDNYINNCPGMWYDKTLMYQYKYYTKKFSFISYKPGHYAIWYGLNDSNGSLIYNNSFIIDTSGETYNSSNMTDYSHDCLLDNIIPHRVQRWGFNSSINIPLDRLKNHTIIGGKINKTLVIINTTSSNITVLENNTIKNSTNVSYHKYTKEELQIDKKIPSTFLELYLTNIIVIVLFGGLMIVIVMYYYNKEYR